jgi:O-antigen ligase
MPGSAVVEHECQPVRPAKRMDGWGLYLLLAVALAPVVVPTGPAQLAILDFFNLLAIGAFGVAFLTRRIEPRTPFAWGILLIGIGSLIATFNAESPSASALAIAQDAYLYVWFIVLVSVLRVRGDLVGLRIAWVGAACIIAVYGLAVLVLEGHTTIARVLGPRGMRAMGTFYDPNMFADYLVMSLFMVLSLGHHMGRALRVAAAVILLAALVATKSNGGALSLVVGLAVWALVRARTLRISVPALAGGALVAVSVGLAGWWMMSSLGIGARGLESLTSRSFMARAGRSSEGRLKIWSQLEQTYRKSPLGIGPGNSRWISLSVEERERRNSMYSKEAHSDYLAYAIERGPLAALALLVLAWQAFGMLAKAWQRRARGGRADRAAGALVAALAGALASSAVHSLTIERLHFRHFWLLLAIVCALAETTRVRGAIHPAAAAKKREEPARELVAVEA